jgi:UDPglucose--hexose-1-phosphate uridylyltransferase
MSNELTLIQEDIKLQIAKLVQFALDHHLLEKWDAVPATNALLDLLLVPESFSGDLPKLGETTVADILPKILDYAALMGILSVDNITHRDLLDARIMGLLMPRQSEVIRQFWRTAEMSSIEQATNAYYQLSIDSNYIRMDRIRKNEYWQTSTEYGDLEITINLSKPEKDPKEIAAERSLPQSSYPKCLLCLENVGYAGRLNHPARQNHRVIPLTLDAETWFLQYSPYVYYNEHSIIFCHEHRPMKISRHTFIRLLDFISQFPHYFIGSNADLPIVGGSILNHDHFQGGRHQFPMEKAPIDISFSHPEFPEVHAGLVKWPMSVIRISGKNREDLVRLAVKIFEEWQSYNDPNVDIVSKSLKDNIMFPHNTITPIARVNDAGDYELDLVLRNNRTTEQHPLGLFHPHEELHHIKKENIGLIEVMGLAVLPGRLKEEIEAISQILTGNKSMDSNILNDTLHPLNKHANWIEQMIEKYGASESREAVEISLRQEIGLKFAQVLADAGVFKRSTSGVLAFRSFMQFIGFKAI